MDEPRTILHVDMDAFYASIEQRDDPSLRGKPVIVGGDGERGVVCAASYEARRFGVHSALASVIAKRRCPHAHFLPVRMSHYVAVSREIFAILRDFTPLCEPLSIDEAFLDVTGSLRLFGGGRAIAEAIRARIKEELDLTASVGVASSKYVAKVASDHDKPDGLVLVPFGEEAAFLAPLPIEVFWGVGPVTAQTLRRLGIEKVDDIQRADPALLEARLGNLADHLGRLARGQDPRPVQPGRRRKSMGSEVTLGEDCADRDALAGHLARQASTVAFGLRSEGLRGRTVVLKIRRPDRGLVTRSETLEHPTDDEVVIVRTAKRLLAEKLPMPAGGVRLIGLQVSGLDPADGQLGLFGASPETEKRRATLKGADAVRRRFGERMIQPASALGHGRRTEASPQAAARAEARGRVKPRPPGGRDEGQSGTSRTNERGRS